MKNSIDSTKYSIIKTEDQIRSRIKELAEEIDESFNGEEVVAIGILKGAFIFYSDLIREMDSLVTCEFLITSSYGEASLTSGEVKIVLDLNSPIKDKNVLLIEDIASDALTLRYIYRNMLSREPKKIKTCCFIKKDFTPLDDNFEIDFIGFSMPDKNKIIGYGVDLEGRYRNLPFLARLES